MSTLLDVFDRERKRARDAREESRRLRELRDIATCGLDMKYAHHHRHESENWINYGTYRVPTSIALRVADQYLVWATEYDAIAEKIEAELALAIALKGTDRD